MPIETYCPNGHHLRTSEAYAGKLGKCPICKAPVHIPVPNPKTVTESAVVDILGVLNAEDHRSGVGKTVIPKSRPAGTIAAVRQLKTCSNCERQIDIGYNVCPYCSKNITALNEF